MLKSYYEEGFYINYLEEFKIKLESEKYNL